MNETVLKNVLDSLDIMWKGMVGLFVVCGCIGILMSIIAKFTKDKKTP
jgi:TRAP-type uncharacterized transport system fused permease subunit